MEVSDELRDFKERTIAALAKLEVRAEGIEREREHHHAFRENMRAAITRIDAELSRLAIDCGHARKRQSDTPPPAKERWGVKEVTRLVAIVAGLIAVIVIGAVALSGGAVKGTYGDLQVDVEAGAPSGTAP